jgi:hypothetical protein
LSDVQTHVIAVSVVAAANLGDDLEVEAATPQLGAKILGSRT